MEWLGTFGFYSEGGVVAFLPQLLFFWPSIPIGSGVISDFDLGANQKEGGSAHGFFLWVVGSQSHSAHERRCTGCLCKHWRHDLA